MRRSAVFIAMLVLAMLAAGWAWDDGAHAATPVISIVNQSAQISDTELADDLPAFQAAVSEEFAAAWGQDATLTTGPSAGWRIVLTDLNGGCGGCEGMHEVVNGVPVGYVYVVSTMAYGEQWSLVLTHELFELLADPWINRLALGGRSWLVEVADPVEDVAFSYERETPQARAIQISDFVTQQWYRSRSKGPWDFGGFTSRPFQILHGGYASFRVPGGWSHLFGSRKPLEL